MLANRTKSQLLPDLQALPDEVKAAIREVCIDRWRPYAQAVMEGLPAAAIVVDRFHAMQAVTNDLKALKNTRKKDLPKAAQACHYPLLKNQEALTETQHDLLQTVYEVDPMLKRAHQLKEQFRAIFETIQTIDEARKQVQKWIGKAYKHQVFPPVITQMKTWLSSMLNYFQHHTTNGPAEGVNHKIKLVKRRAYGFRNFGNFRLRILTAFL